MHLLFSESEEFGYHRGLDLLKGRIVRLPANLRVPHMGWNQLHLRQANGFTQGVAESSFVYFVHSYYAQPSSQDIVLMTTDYEIEFPAVVHTGQHLGDAVSSGEEPACGRAAAGQLCAVMKIYPAIDILGGSAVRLKQGRKEDVTVYGDPVEMARKWVSLGAEWLHIVDLDGAFEGLPKNLNVLRNIVSAVPGAKVQLGGGIRNMSTVETLLGVGIARVILGTAAVQDHEFVERVLVQHPGSVAIGIDARDGKVQISGWVQDSRIGAIELARKLEQIGARLVIYTDISKDGVMEGPNLAAMREMLEKTNLLVIASGGVSTLSDVQHLAAIDHPRLEGAIIGKALYEGPYSD
jgi:phosphoribosylformimino-5-aminoimidazole carboxamide ribotide isomerase